MIVKIACMPEKLPKFFDTSVKVKKATLEIAEKEIIIKFADRTINIQYQKILQCELKKYYKLGTYISIKSKPETLNFFIPRINLFDWFIINNYFKIKKVFNILKDKCK